MTKRKSLNSVKFVLSLLVVILFSALILNSDKFYKSESPVFVGSSFVWMWDYHTEIIDVGNIVEWDYDSERWVLQYVVQPWDSLWKIAMTFGTTVSHLKKINSLKDGVPIRPNQKLILTDEDKWFLYSVPDKTNIVVFANKYWLNVQDLMTLNYIQDETELLYKWQDLFINIDLENAYKVWLKERPRIKTIPKVTKVAYRPVISTQVTSNSSSSSSSSTSSTTSSSTNYVWKSTIIRQRVYKKPIKNRFYAWHCTWWAAILTPEIFPYIDEYTQARPFGWDGRMWYDNAKAAGFEVGPTPRVGSLVVYNKWFWAGAWHVGKVIWYYPEKKQIIVRDMNRKWKFIYTDRRENIVNPNIRGYIYLPTTPWKPS